MTDLDATVPVLLKMRAELAQHLRPERLRPLGYADRAQFIRDAIAEKLGVPKSIALMKSREGVGGAPSHKARGKPVAPAIRYTVAPAVVADAALNDADSGFSRVDAPAVRPKLGA